MDNRASDLIAPYAGHLRVRICGLLARSGQLLMLRHQGLPGAEIFWSTPGGGLEYGETMFDCLRREFLEETGLTIGTIGACTCVNEYLRQPLHAIELFYTVQDASGEARLGSDPEAEPGKQVLAELAWMLPLDILFLDEDSCHKACRIWAAAELARQDPKKRIWKG